MSWIPPDLANTCTPHTTITTCQPQTFLFLQLVAQLFGRSRDSRPTKGFLVGGYGTPTVERSSSDFDQFQANEFAEFLKHNTFVDDGLNGGEDFYSDIKAPLFEGHPEQERLLYRQEFDFIVIGAGSAGCVVANRLSEVPHWQVLLLEAGSEEPEVASVPAFPPLLQQSSIDWGYMTQPSSHSCLARDNGQCPWARGRVMGGSSTINYMIYIRGNPRDYDEWAELGNKGWSYEEVLPYFIKSEDNRNPDKVDPRYHGVGGEQTVEEFPYQDINTIATIKAYEELGLPYIDQNSNKQIGTMLLQHTTRNGRRVSTNVAFIRPIRRKRRNLTIRTQAEVVRVLIDSKTKIAFGVEYMRKGKLVRAIARKEVILSAGAINSPKVLMLSGIGPYDELSSHGINCLVNSPVGYNLQDHTTIDGVVFALTNKTATTVSDQQQTQDVYSYRQTNRGPLSSTGPLQSNAFVQTKYEQEHDRPDIQISLDAVNVNNFFTDPLLTASTAVGPLSYYDGMMSRVIVLNPKSRGQIRLNYSDPIYGAPLIITNTFYEQIDLLRMVEGIKQSLNLLTTKAYRHLGVRLVSTPLPACQHYTFGSDEYWACISTSYTTTIFHPSGTCKMGPQSDHSAVVDPHLQVYGVKKLRVIDASIMPIIVRGNTNAPTIMIAEKGSDLIKQRWLKSDSKYHSDPSTPTSEFDFSHDFFGDT